jgi:hypothetical protein
MKKIIVIIGLCILQGDCIAQPASQYNLLASKADSLFWVKLYKEAAFTYSLAFSKNKDMGAVKHRYAAATCWALSLVPDSAFYQLNRIATKGGYMDYNQITTDVNFSKLKEDKRWSPLIEQVLRNKEAFEAKINPGF